MALSMNSSSIAGANPHTAATTRETEVTSNSRARRSMAQDPINIPVSKKSLEARELSLPADFVEVPKDKYLIQQELSALGLWARCVSDQEIIIAVAGHVVAGKVEYKGLLHLSKPGAKDADGHDLLTQFL